MVLPRLVITGASGFIGRRLLDGLKDDFEIVALARRSQARCGAPVHPNLSWFQTDIGDRTSVATAFRFIRETGGADFVIHLAAHYDFTGDDHPEYWRTNVEGMRMVLEECRSLELARFIFASSLAACRFPPKGQVLDESSPPDGEHVYARSKRLGEELLAEAEADVPSVIVRFAAIFSDWCEYAPFHTFIETWLSRGWNSRLLGGRGESAVPYLHARELAPFMYRLIRSHHRLGRREVVIASPNHTVTHLELFRLANRYAGRDAVRPILIPAPIARVGVWGRDLVGRLVGERPFERPWMLDYLDRDLAVDASRTQELIGWQPRERLFMSRRMAFVVDHRRSDPIEWTARNQAALKTVHLRPNPRIHRLLERHQDRIRDRVMAALTDGPEVATRFPTVRDTSAQVLEWRFTVAFRHILNSVRAQDRGLFLAYCGDYAGKRFRDGAPASETVAVLRLVGDTALEVVSADPEAADLEDPLHLCLSMTVEFGCDQVLEVYEDLSGEVIPDPPEGVD
jgi:nucleoside-diphosphate-sugar epimerase